VTFIYAVYFKETVAGGESRGDFYWSLGISLSMLITAIISPILGAISDYSAGRKRFLLFFTLLCVLATASLYFIGPGDVFWGLLLFILANVGFEAGLVFYDSFIPEITTPKNYGRVSGYGFAFGYAGSLASLAIALPFIQEKMIRETFPVSALFFLIFAIPIFIFLADSRKAFNKDKSYLRIGFERVKFTITHVRQYKNLSRFLLAFFFYIEGVNTVIYFSGNYASTTLGFSMEELIVFFIIVQTTAIAGSVVFGVISDSVGQKKTIILSLYIWIGTIILAFLVSSETGAFVVFLVEKLDLPARDILKYGFYVVGLFAGGVMGATQATSRSLMSRLTPEHKRTEFFGFYSFFGKSSAIVGPLVFGSVSYLTGSQRIAILTVLFFFIVGIILIGKVDEPAKEQSE